MESFADIMPLVPGEQVEVSRQSVEAALRVLKLRRAIMERMCSVGEYEAQIAINESTIGELSERLKLDFELNEWQKRHIEGRIAEAKARINTAQHQIEQAGLEAKVYRSALIK